MRQDVPQRRAAHHLLLVGLAMLIGFGVLATPAGAQDDPPEDEGPTEVARATLIDRKGTRDRDDDEPVEGASILVEAVTLDAAGEIVERAEVGTAETDEEGRFELDLPGPGTYAATLDVDSLPDEVGIAEGAETVTFPIDPGASRTLIFDLGARERDVATRLDRAVDLFRSGLVFGVTIAICAVGLSLIFGTTGLTNFAHGELVTFGAIAAWYINVEGGLHLVPATVLALFVGAAASGLTDRLLWRPLRNRGMTLVAQMVVSIGFSLALRNAFQYAFGETRRPFAQYAVQRSIEVGPFTVTPKELWIVGLSVAAMVGVALVLQRTRMGKAMRAVSDNPDLAASSGIDVNRVVLYVWMMGGALAVLGGVMLGLQQRVGFNMGFTLLLLMFAGITLGGLGTAYGALLGCVIVGLLVDLSTLFVPSELKTVGALVVLILVLLVRPQGILGRAERIG